MGRIGTFFGSLKLWWKRQRTAVKGGIIIAIIIALIVLLGGKKDVATSIETVRRQDLVRSVAATGSVVSATDLSLSFQESNLVRSINVGVGDKVYKGQILATLANASEAADVAQANAKLLSAQAALKKASEGSGGEEIRRAEIAVENARRELYSSDLVARNDEGEVDERSPIITGTYNGSQEGDYRIYFDNVTYEAHYSGLEKGKVWVGAKPVPLGTRGLMISFPIENYSMGDEWRVSVPAKEGASYTQNLSAYKNAVADLDLKKTVAPSDIDAAEADVAAAQGALAAAQADYEKTIIRAPANGTVTKVDIKLGQLAETFVPVITIQDIGNLYIEANVNESNISDIAIGQPVTVTYDALGKDRIFETTVSSVDLGATVVDGIVNYKVKALVPEPEEVRPGMTANLSVRTAFAPNVIVIPERVIDAGSSGEAPQVTVVDEEGEHPSTRAITTGLHGDGGLVEITSGLSEGERVLFKQE